MGIIKTLFDILGDIICAIIEAIFDCIKAFITSDRKTEMNADFLPASELLSSSNKGFCLNGKKSLSIQDSFKNALVVGSTGNFKSSGVLIPSLLKMCGHSSIVVTDFSGELQLKTSGAFISAGYDVNVIDWGNPDASEGYNPLKHLTNTTSDIQKLSKMEVVTALGTGSKDPFWNLSAEAVCNLMTKYIVRHAPPEYQSLYNVYHLVSAFGYQPDNLDKLFLRANDPELLAEYKTFNAYGSKMLVSIIATCRAALSIFGTDPNVALTTSHDTIDFASFRQRKKVLYITTNTKDMRYYSLITSLFLEQFFGEVMSQLPKTGDLPVFFLIDEASSLYFNNLQIVVSNIRKYNAGILQIYQSAAQLVDLYGQSIAKAITENSYARVYMSGQPISVAQELESTLGKFEYWDDKEVRHIRSLMTADEIRQSDESLILCGNKPAIKTQILPYFKQSRLNRLAQLRPYQPANKLPYDKPPLLSLD
jgi:type IV secretory pathway TraG/TraD family ATPase VirD4